MLLAACVCADFYEILPKDPKTGSLKLLSATSHTWLRPLDWTKRERVVWNSSLMDWGMALHWRKWLRWKLRTDWLAHEANGSGAAHGGHGPVAEGQVLAVDAPQTHLPCREGPADGPAAGRTAGGCVGGLGLEGFDLGGVRHSWGLRQISSSPGV